MGTGGWDGGMGWGGRGNYAREDSNLFKKPARKLVRVFVRGDN